MIPESSGDSFGVPLRNTYPNNMDGWKFQRERRRPLIALPFLSPG